MNGAVTRLARDDLSVYAVLDAAVCGRALEYVVPSVLRGGARCLQVRDKQATARELYQLVCAAGWAVRGQDAPAVLLVNDRVDVAVAAARAGYPVAGCHIGQDDLPPAAARAVLGPGAVVGLSVSTPEEVAAAAALPPGTVDYLGISPVYATATKPDAPVPVGLGGAARLAALAAEAGLPCVGIGGLSAADAAPLRAAGLAGLAVVSAICADPDHESATRTLVEAWARAGHTQEVHR